MIIPSFCPACGDPLVTEYRLVKTDMEFMNKECKSKLDHWIRFTASSNATEVEELVIALSRDPWLRVGWSFLERTIIVLPGTMEEIIRNRWDEHPTYIPYFEPDLSDYKKLVEKIRTYLVFS